jgi:hypothetical protein
MQRETIGHLGCVFLLPTKSRVLGRMPWANFVECVLVSQPTSTLQDMGCVGLGIHPGDHRTRAHPPTHTHTHARTRTNPSRHRTQDRHKKVCCVLQNTLKE